MIELRQNELIVRTPGVHEQAECSIQFQRTLRIPDDNREHPLPAGLGAFPIFHVDDYADNLDELEIIQQNAPTVVAGATQVSVTPVNRVGSNTTTISTVFNDTDQPGVGAFNVTLRIREPDNTTEVVLVNNQPNGGGGLTISDNGGGSYTASYTYDPSDRLTSMNVYLATLGISSLTTVTWACSP